MKKLTKAQIKLRRITRSGAIIPVKEPDDKMKIVKHGLDLVTSFRKMKQK